MYYYFACGQPKILHIDKNIVEDIIRLLNEKFGKESPLTTTRGKVLEYLGMMLDYMTKGKVKISMYDYIDKLLTELPLDMNGLVKTPHWWVDSSYAVHPDMHSHSGIFMSLGKGALYLTSCKQKLNTKSSTEAELVAIDDVMGQILWTRNFLNGQGISMTSTTNIYQDNKSTILLAENGKGSSSRHTRHLDVRYFS